MCLSKLENGKSKPEECTCHVGTGNASETTMLCWRPQIEAMIDRSTELTHNHPGKRELEGFRKKGSLPKGIWHNGDYK